MCLMKNDKKNERDMHEPAKSLNNKKGKMDIKKKNQKLGVQ